MQSTWGFSKSDCDPEGFFFAVYSHLDPYKEIQKYGLSDLIVFAYSRYMIHKMLEVNPKLHFSPSFPSSDYSDTGQLTSSTTKRPKFFPMLHVALFI